MKLAEHNRIQMIWVPGHMGIDGNEMADQLTRQGYSHQLTGPEAALGIFAKVAWGVIGGLDEQETCGALAVHSWTKAS